MNHPYRRSLASPNWREGECQCLDCIYSEDHPIHELPQRRLI